MNKTIGFIGLGVMGKSMAANLLGAGNNLYVYTRTKEKARELLDRKAQWADSPAAIAQTCEAIAYAKKSGLDPDTVLKSISSGAAGSWLLSNPAPRMLAGNFDPGFYVKHFIKDMDIAAEAADSLALDTPGLDLTLQLYRRLADNGYENEGTQALYRLYDQ